MDYHWPKTKDFERQIAAYVGTHKAVCLNSATAAMEMALRLLCPVGCSPSGDLDGFVNAIVELSQHPERCEEMGRNGRDFILKNLTREVGTRKYVEVIKSVAIKR